MTRGTPSMVSTTRLTHISDVENVEKILYTDVYVDVQVVDGLMQNGEKTIGLNGAFLRYN